MWCGGRRGRPCPLAFKLVYAQKLVLDEFQVFFELFGHFEGELTKAADLLAKGGVLRGRTAGAKVVGGFGVERVDGGGHGGVLILQCVDVLASLNALVGVIFLNFRQEIRKTGGEESNGEFARLGRILSFFQ